MCYRDGILSDNLPSASCHAAKRCTEAVMFFGSMPATILMVFQGLLFTSSPVVHISVFQQRVSLSKISHCQYVNVCLHVVCICFSF